jgi:predicted PhzF superfamily epimerase YddE/YHI9
MQRRFHQLDVFSAQPLKGNPLAVVHAAEGLSDAAMAAFARWTNLSETTFLLPPSDAAAAASDYRVRIFTPGGELPFAGHPTLGSCAAWLAAGGVPKQAGVVVQECGVGLVRIRRDGTRLAFCDSRRFAKVRLVKDVLGSADVSKLGWDALLALPPVEELKAQLVTTEPKEHKVLLVT